MIYKHGRHILYMCIYMYGQFGNYSGLFYLVCVCMLIQHMCYKLRNGGLKMAECFGDQARSFPSLLVSLVVHLAFFKGALCLSGANSACFGAPSHVPYSSW